MHTMTGLDRAMGATTRSCLQTPPRHCASWCLGARRIRQQHLRDPYQSLIPHSIESDKETWYLDGTLVWGSIPQTSSLGRAR